MVRMTAARFPVRVMKRRYRHAGDIHVLADVQIDCHTGEGIGLLTTVAVLTDEVVGHIEEGIFATSVTSSDSLRSLG